uniref:ATPase AAA-type core domain-containing protein n=1 Tax=Oryza punctata TaxID=4537 RepID=A0A0E0KHN9_ORYPU
MWLVSPAGRQARPARCNGSNILWKGMRKNCKPSYRGYCQLAGYLLHGPLGTMKLTMLATMADYLGYDVYDLELTFVETNTELRKLLI